MYIPILVLELTVYHMPIAVDNSKWSLLYVTYQPVCRFQRFLQCVLLVILSLNVVIIGWKKPTRCNCMQIFIYCKITLHVLGIFIWSRLKTLAPHIV